MTENAPTNAPADNGTSTSNAPSSEAKVADSDRLDRPVQSLSQEKKAAKALLKAVRQELADHGGRLSKDVLESLQASMAALEKAIQDKDATLIAHGAHELEKQVQVHLNFEPKSAAAEYTLAIVEALIIALLIRIFLVEPYKIPSGSMIPTLLIGDHLFISKISYGVRIPLLGKQLAHWGGYRRGDVIVFVNPLDSDRPLLRQRDYIKRIVGLPGDKVEVIGEVLHINGVPQERKLLDERFTYFDYDEATETWNERHAELLEETLLQDAFENGQPPANPTFKVHEVLRDAERFHDWKEGPFIVPEGHLFTMGDNRDNSLDGRYARDGGWFVPFNHVKGRAFGIWFSWGENGVRFSRFAKGI